MKTNSKERLLEMNFLDHLAELRRRLLITAAAVCLGGTVVFIFADHVFELIALPYHRAFPDQLLIGTGPAEAFILKLKAALFGGAILVAPVIFYQIWLFIAPGLYKDEKKLIYPFLITTSLLFAIGIWFCYTAVIPYALRFFQQQYESINVVPTVRLSEHMNFLIRALFGFGLVFEMPVVAFFLGKLGIITPQMMLQGSRYAIIVIFIIAAVMTPPDVLTQFLMAGPLVLLYGISILVVKFTTSPERTPSKAAR